MRDVTQGKPCRLAAALAATVLSLPALAEVERRGANNGNLLMEDVPEIPADIVGGLRRFQNVRSAGFLAFSAAGDSVFINTRFGDVGQIHRVDRPGGARRQITYSPEPVGGVTRQPGRDRLIFTRDAGGSEFAQVFLLDPNGGEAAMLTDGESRNGAVVWDRDGRRLAWQSTRRNGVANDLWLMDPEAPGEARLILKSPDGSWWGPAEFSASGTRLLVLNYVSVTDSRIYLLDLDSGDLQLLAGGGAAASVNYPLAFDDDGDGFWFITDRFGEFQQLAWQSFEPGSEALVVTGDIPWNVSGGAISRDRRRAAFTVNEGGRTAVYLLDPKRRKYRRVDSIPLGLAGGLTFSPNGRRLAMTLNTARSPSDTFVLDLGRGALDYGKLVRWTFSEVGGLDTRRFREPELIEYPSFDRVAGQRRRIPAWLYKPAGDGQYLSALAPATRRRGAGAQRARFVGLRQDLRLARQRLSARGFGKGYRRAARLGGRAAGSRRRTGRRVRRQLRRLHGARQRRALQRPAQGRRRYRRYLELRDLPRKHSGLPPRSAPRRVRRRARPTDAGLSRVHQPAERR